MINETRPESPHVTAVILLSFIFVLGNFVLSEFERFCYDTYHFISILALLNLPQHAFEVDTSPETSGGKE